MNEKQEQGNYRLARLIKRFEAMSHYLDKMNFTAEELMQLAQYYEQECLLVRTEEILDLAITTFPYNVDFLLYRAQILIRSEQEEMAMATLETAENLAPKNLKVQLLRVEALSQLELYDDALTILEGLKDTASQLEVSDIYLYEANVYHKMGLHERQFYMLKASLQENPKNEAALKSFWMAVEFSKKHKESIKFHRSLIDMEPYSAVAWFNLGQSLTYFCEYEEAIEAYEFAYTIKQKFEGAYFECGELCFMTGDYKKALECYEELLKNTQPTSDLFLSVGKCYQKLGNYAVAKTFFEKSLHYDAMNDEALFHIGECLSKEGSWKKAISNYFYAVKLQDANEEYYAALGEAYFQLGDFEKAESFFAEAADIAPETSEYWIQYATFLMEVGKAEKGLEILEEATYYAVGAELTYCKSACLFTMKQRNIALQVLGEALEEDYDMHEAIFTLIPELETDREVRAIISAFQPY